MNILQINGSARSEGANSTRVANDIVARLKVANPQAKLVLRDLARNPAPVVDEAALGALFTPAEQRTPEQAARVIVIGVPMYNFSISVQLKNWIDAIARAGVTFRYTENGPEGLIKGKKVILAFARGGRYRGTPADTQTPFLQTVLGFLGMTDLRLVYAEGLNMGEDAAQQGFAEAEADMAAALA